MGDLSLFSERVQPKCQRANPRRSKCQNLILVDQLLGSQYALGFITLIIIDNEFYGVTVDATRLVGMLHSI